MSDDVTTFDVGAAVDTAATAVREVFGLGDGHTLTGTWPVDDGDRVFGFAFGGDLTGVMLLAVDEEVATRLETDPGRLADGFGRVLAAVATSTGLTLELGGPDGVGRAPDQSAEIADDGRLCALFGIALDDVAAVEAATDDGAPAETATPPAGTAVPTFEPAPVHAATAGVGGLAATPLSMLHDVDMEVTVELGRTTMPIRDLLALQPGTVVEIDRVAGSPIDVLVNGRLIACGEVVVIDEEFGVRITEIVSSGVAG